MRRWHNPGATNTCWRGISWVRRFQIRPLRTLSLRPSVRTKSRRRPFSTPSSRRSSRSSLSAPPRLSALLLRPRSRPSALPSPTTEIFRIILNPGSERRASVRRVERSTSRTGVLKKGAMQDAVRACNFCELLCHLVLISGRHRSIFPSTARAAIPEQSRGPKGQTLVLTPRSSLSGILEPRVPARF